MDIEMETSKQNPGADKVDRRVARRLAGRLSGEAGMTMLEILIVLAILALVMGFLFGPRIMEMFSEGKAGTAELMVNKYANEAYARWTMDNRGEQCPSSLEDLAKYTNNESTEDPWGNQLIMVCGENAPEGVPNRFGVTSKGEDGKEGTEDDIRSWGKKGKK